MYFRSVCLWLFIHHVVLPPRTSQKWTPRSSEARPTLWSSVASSQEASMCSRSGPAPWPGLDATAANCTSRPWLRVRIQPAFRQARRAVITCRWWVIDTYRQLREVNSWNGPNLVWSALKLQSSGHYTFLETGRRYTAHSHFPLLCLFSFCLWHLNVHHVNKLFFFFFVFFVLLPNLAFFFLFATVSQNEVEGALSLHSGRRRNNSVNISHGG